jgi:AcrR family transcriptional regulator
MEPKPPPKRRNAVQTRSRILAAAAQEFARQGYAQAGIRDIAKEAGVATSLLLRYFGSKANLFEEALLHAMVAQAVFERDKTRFGERMAHLLVTEGDTNLTAMIVRSSGDMEARAITARITQTHAVEGLARWLGPPNATARAVNILILCTGFVVQCHQIADAPPPKATVKWLARTLQEIVDETSPGTA